MCNNNTPNLNQSEKMPRLRRLFFGGAVSFHGFWNRFFQARSNKKTSTPSGGSEFLWRLASHSNDSTFTAGDVFHFFTILLLTTLGRNFPHGFLTSHGWGMPFCCPDSPPCFFFPEKNPRFAGKFFFANKNRTTGARFQQRFPDKEVSPNASASMKNDTSCARGWGVERLGRTKNYCYILGDRLIAEQLLWVDFKGF